MGQLSSCHEPLLSPLLYKMHAPDFLKVSAMRSILDNQIELDSVTSLVKRTCGIWKQAKLLQCIKDQFKLTDSSSHLIAHL